MTKTFGYYDEESRVEDARVEFNRKMKYIYRYTDVNRRLDTFLIKWLKPMEDAEKLSIYYTVDYWGEPSLTIGLRKGITWLEFIRVFSGVEDYGFAFEDIR